MFFFYRLVWFYAMLNTFLVSNLNTFTLHCKCFPIFINTVVTLIVYCFDWVSFYVLLVFLLFRMSPTAVALYYKYPLSALWVLKILSVFLQSTLNLLCMYAFIHCTCTCYTFSWILCYHGIRMFYNWVFINKPLELQNTQIIRNLSGRSQWVWLSYIGHLSRIGRERCCNLFIDFIWMYASCWLLFNIPDSVV